MKNVIIRAVKECFNHSQKYCTIFGTLIFYMFKIYIFKHMGFDTKCGLNLYAISIFAILIVWIYCLFIVTTELSTVFAFFIIPLLLFCFGKKYLKHKKDFFHLKIHKCLMLFNWISIFSIVPIGFMPITATILSTLLSSILVFNIITTFALYFNALGGNKILDFIANALSPKYQGGN